MNKPAANVRPCTDSRAASVNSNAARWPAGIFDVSISGCGSSTGFSGGSTRGDFKAVIIIMV
jgi:hypothetical protein